MKRKRHERPLAGIRSKVALDAYFQSGAGAHGGTARAKNRRDRKQAKQDLKRQDT